MQADALRRLLLVQAIEEADTRGRLLGAAERDPIEREARAAVAGPDLHAAPDPLRYLDERSRRILATVALRDPRTAALQRGDPLLRLLAWALPLLALLLGAALEQLDNARQVNLLSPPLLAFLGWNLLVYLALLLRPLLPRGAAGPLLDRLADVLARGGTGARALRPEIAARLRLRWWQAAGAMEGWRLQQVFHASAAAWAVGVGLAMAAGGLVRQYHVGWESTWLDASQVHALLGLLFAPVAALLPLEGFSLADVQRLHLGSGAPVGPGEARHWILQYLALLALLVVVPRTLLALHAGLRRRWAGRALPVDLRTPYVAQLLARVRPAQLVLAWAATDDACRALMLRMWAEAGGAPGGRPPPAGQPWPLLHTAQGDELIVVEHSLAVGEPESPGGRLRLAAPAGWRARLLAWWSPAQATVPGTPDEREPAQARPAGPPADLLLLAADTPAAALSRLPHVLRSGLPVLLLAGGAPESPQLLRQALQARLPRGEVLGLEAVAGAWWREAPLREALARHLPEHQHGGAARLFEAWQAHQADRLAEALRVMADVLLAAAGEAEPVAQAPVSLLGMVDGARREAAEQARRTAMATVLARIDVRRTRAMDELARLQGRPGGEGLLALQQAAHDFTHRRPVDLPQAGMAGAASGAAAGATEIGRAHV